jgi:hypothetical protein
MLDVLWKASRFLYCSVSYQYYNFNFLQINDIRSASQKSAECQQGEETGYKAGVCRWVRLN